MTEMTCDREKLLDIIERLARRCFSTHDKYTPDLLVSVGKEEAFTILEEAGRAFTYEVADGEISYAYIRD